MTKDLPTPETLRKLLRYNPETGKLFWRHRKDVRAQWNGRYAGTEAFTGQNAHGYLRSSIFGKDYFAHRVIWAMQTGNWPVEHIDHVNGDKADNRLSNLREATTAQNAYNRGAQKNNKSGFKGVCWHKRCGKWTAQIRLHGKQKHLGCFSTPEQAHVAYSAASKKLHGEFGRTK